MECMYIRGARYSTALYLDFDFAFVGCGLCLFTMQPWPRDVAWLCVCTHPRWQVVTSGMYGSIAYTPTGQVRHVRKHVRHLFVKM